MKAHLLRGLRPLGLALETHLSSAAPSNTQRSSWPGNTATTSVHSSSDPQAKHPAWRFGELEINGSGSMPQLAGFSRHIALLEGEGLLVMHGSTERTELLSIGEHGQMDLTDANEVELIDGPVRLLDVVVDNTHYVTHAQVLDGENTLARVDAELLIVFALQGERIHCILEEHEFVLGAQQWMRIEQPQTGDFQCTDGQVLLLAVQAV